MSKSKKSLASKIKKNLISFLVLFIFIVPMFTTMKWLHVVAFGDDPRKVVSIKDAKPQVYSDLKPFDEPLITITFDDGWETIHSQGFRIMELYGIKSTQYVLGDEFGHYSYMSEGQLRSMQKAGHEIASHSMSHPNLTELDEEDIEIELGKSRDMLAEKFGQIHDFATPLGAYNDTVIEKSKKFYRSHRNTDADPAEVDSLDVNVRTNFNPYNIIAYTVRRTTTLDDIRRLIEYTERNNGWLVLTYHQIDDSDAHFGVTAQAFEEQIKLVAKSSARKPIMSQVLDILVPVRRDD